MAKHYRQLPDRFRVPTHRPALLIALPKVKTTQRSVGRLLVKRTADVLHRGAVSPRTHELRDSVKRFR